MLHGTGKFPGVARHLLETGDPFPGAQTYCGYETAKLVKLMFPFGCHARLTMLYNARQYVYIKLGQLAQTGYGFKAGKSVSGLFQDH